MKTAREFYRKLNNDNLIPDIGELDSFSPEQMIWFAEEYAQVNQPSDEEIEKQVNRSRKYRSNSSTYHLPYREGFIEGAKWARDYQVKDKE